MEDSRKDTVKQKKNWSKWIAILAIIAVAVVVVAVVLFTRGGQPPKQEATGIAQSSAMPESVQTNLTENISGISEELKEMLEKPSQHKNEPIELTGVVTVKPMDHEGLLGFNMKVDTYEVLVNYIMNDTEQIDIQKGDTITVWGIIVDQTIITDENDLQKDAAIVSANRIEKIQK